VSDQNGVHRVSDQNGVHRVSDQVGVHRVSDQNGVHRVSDQVGVRRVSDQVGVRRVSDPGGVPRVSDGVGAAPPGAAADPGGVAAVLDWLGPHPSFIAAVRALDAAGRAAGRNPVGTLGPPEQETLLFRAQPSLGFPPADVAALRPGEAGWPAEMEVTFLGLYGPSSPLPPGWTERIAQDDSGARNLRDLLDLFTHPLVGLLYRAWQASRPEMLWREDASDIASVAALALAGVMPGAPAGLPAERLLPVAGLLAAYARGAGTVESAVRLAFDAPAVVEEWVPQHVAVPVAQQALLGGPGARLGEAVAGERVPDVSGCVRLRIGPLALGAFVALLPGGSRRAELAALLRVVVADPVRVEVELVLAGGQSLGATLGGTRLGFTSWIGDPAEERACPAGAA
jgi:type VI secretion system protein ImpH